MKVNKYPEYEVEVYTSTINNMNVICIPNKKFKSTEVNLFVDFGATDIKYKFNNKEYQTLLGAAHFIEHKIFELNDGSDAFNLLSSYGADANAYTTYDETAYMFSCTDNLYKCFDVFLNFILTNTLNDKTINKEKGIIIEELMMYLDKPSYILQEKLINLLYKTSYIKNPILGTEESINKMNEEVLSNIFEAFYNPKNMVLQIVGNFDVDEMESYLENELNKYKFDEFTTEKIYPIEQDEVVSNYEEVEIDSEVNYVGLGIKLNPNITKDYFKNDFITDAYTFMLFSRSTEKINNLLEEEVMFNDYSYYTIFNPHYSFIEFFATSDKQDELIKELKDSIINFKKNFIEEDFNLYKKIAYSNFIYNLDNLTELCEEVSVGLKEKFDYFEHNQILDTITKDDILKFSDTISEDNISIIKSKKK